MSRHETEALRRAHRHLEDVEQRISDCFHADTSITVHAAQAAALVAVADQLAWLAMMLEERLDALEGGGGRPVT